MIKNSSESCLPYLVKYFNFASDIMYSKSRPNRIVGQTFSVIDSIALILIRKVDFAINFYIKELCQNDSCISS
jgi:hypothetical protein